MNAPQDAPQKLEERTYVVELERGEKFWIETRLEALKGARTADEQRFLDKMQKLKPKARS